MMNEKKYAEQMRSLSQDQAAQSNQLNQSYGGTCPSCGYCPHCGRSNFQPYPNYPYWTYPSWTIYGASGYVGDANTPNISYTVNNSGLSGNSSLGSIQ